jgi:hypothetical protein
MSRREKEAFGQAGCGIDWSHVAEESQVTHAGSREVVYRGDTCNCQGRMIYDNGIVVGLVLRSAC